MIKRGLTLVSAMHISASVFINTHQSRLHHNHDVWLEELAPNAPIDQAGPKAGFEDDEDEASDVRRRTPEAS
jgi:thiamine phosphate synthase YjbQ (UPF0047 family)